MSRETNKVLHIIHLMLGLFFAIFGVIMLIGERYLFGTWILSLGLFFLLSIAKEKLRSKLNPKLLDVLQYFLAAVVLITGITEFLTRLNIL